MNAKGEHLEGESIHLLSIEYRKDRHALSPDTNQSMLDLYRSLASQNMVAFVGSGASMSLGHCSWDGLADEEITTIEKQLEEYNAGISNPQIEDCRSLLAKAKEAGDALGAFDKLSLAADALQRALDVLAAEASKDAESSADGIRKAVADARKRLFQNKASIGLKLDWIRKLDSTENPASRNPAYRKCVSLLRDEYGQFVVKDGDEESKRFPVDFTAGIRLVASLAGDSANPDDKIDADILLASPGPSIDVLGTLRNEWKITRYVTLNFDHEIERMLERGDYPFLSLTKDRLAVEEKAKAARDGRRGGRGNKETIEQSRLGARARVVDLNEENYAELLLFAANSPAGMTQVLHLHGSAHRPEGMIITDGDYNRRYYGSDALTHVLSDGQELLYGGNAIVFIGVGMREDELLRAASILAQSPARLSRPIYAFLGAENECKDRALQVKLYQRYGIHVVFYGTTLGTSADAEVGSYAGHPLIKAAEAFVRNAGEEADAAKIAPALASMQSEIDFLKGIKAVLKARLAHLQAKAADKNKTARLVTEHLERIRDGIEDVIREVHGSGSAAEAIACMYDYPRLMLTPWHGSIFRLVVTEVQNIKDKNMDEARANALLSATDALVSAVMGRALEDALAMVALDASKWVARWERCPNGSQDKPRFRRVDWSGDNRYFAHNISVDHTDMPDGARTPSERAARAYLERLLADPKGKDALEALRHLLGDGRAMTAHVLKEGGGKGIAATKFAFSDAGSNGNATRIVMSVGASCSRDVTLDTLASTLVKAMASKKRKSAARKIQLVVSKFDLLVTKSEERTKLSEWQLFLRHLRETEGLHTVLMCSWIESKRYLQREQIHIDDAAKRLRSPGIFVAEDKVEKGSIDSSILRIVTSCECIWVASFLSSLRAEIVDAEGGPERTVREAFFAGIVDRIDSALRQAQDPKQRVPAVLDVAISELERYTIRHLDYASRKRKVLAHAILKHLFAFGGPVGGHVFTACPEIRRIFEDYKETPESGAKAIEDAIRWLLRLDMVTELVDREGGKDGKEAGGKDKRRLRYGLHGQMRNYLAVKKGLPFAVVHGREHVAITLLPMIDDEVIALQPSDYEFIWDTLEALLKGDEGGSEAIAERIRAAFMLLRGSMRLGNVLREKSPQQDHRGVGVTPLERYLGDLLLLRSAVLRWKEGDTNASISAPLYRREWIWLFNEMGVVALLIGHMDDACRLFEQAAKFEQDRIRDKDGYEWYRQRIAGIDAPGAASPDVRDQLPEPHFTISLCRILLNMAIVESERGAFDRASRILAGRRVDFASMQASFDGSDPGAAAEKASTGYEREKPSGKPAAAARPPGQKGKQPDAALTQQESGRQHREVRLLALVGELLHARIRFLEGGAGNATHALVGLEEAIIAEGVPGLTAWYFHIRADIESKRANHREADVLLKTARTESEASGRADLILSVMLAESENDMRQQALQGGTRIRYHLSRIHEIKQEARRMGILRVVVSASMIRAKLYLSMGEYRSARYDILSAIELANMHGMNIKRVSSLVVLAALIGSMGDELREDALVVARGARYEAERIGYQLAAMNATELEIVLREGGSIEDWAAGHSRPDAVHSGRIEWAD